MHVALRGDLRKKGELVPRRYFTLFSGQDENYHTGGKSGRKELADSVVHPDNPLTARVFVNRVWQWHFGEGLVRTPSNFGILGEKTDASQTARLVGGGLCASRLVTEAAPPADHVVVHLADE